MKTDILLAERNNSRTTKEKKVIFEVISELKTHHTIKNGQKYRRGRILEILHVHVVLHVHVMLHIH
jgi:hypothetical protein